MRHLFSGHLVSSIVRIRFLAAGPLLACAVACGGGGDDGTDSGGGDGGDGALDSGEAGDGGGSEVDNPDGGLPDGADTEGDRADAPDELTGDECVDDFGCDDDNICTDDHCDDGYCVFTPVSAVLPDPVVGDCMRPVCEGDAARDEPDDTDVPWDDGIDCTVERCSDGEPVHVPNHALCSDGDNCNGRDQCTAEGCDPGTPPEDPDSDIDGDGTPDCEDFEECDGLDNDGDGAVDSPLDLPELGEPCYTGPAGTQGIGECRSGEIRCVRGVLACSGEVVPLSEELCDDRDNTCDGVTPVSEAEAGCGADVTVGAEEQGTRVEFETEIGAIDVHFNIDTTGSMGGVLTTITNALRDRIVPGIEAEIPVAAYGVSTFEDFPFSPFGNDGDLPFELWQRVTSDLPTVERALDVITLGSGGDGPESGIESLYQVCAGDGVTWPERIGTDSSRCGSGGKTGPIATRELNDDDWYVVELEGGEELEVHVFSSCAGQMNSFLQLYQGAGGPMVSSDESLGPSEDARMTYRVPSAGQYFVHVGSRGGGGSAPWYQLTVLVDDEPWIPAGWLCSALETGATTSSAVPLFPWEIVGTNYVRSECEADCGATGAPADWTAAYCRGGPDPEFEADVCGNGWQDAGEMCDDGNGVRGDGCEPDCTVPSVGVPAFDPMRGYDPSLGHGIRGGVGFRDEALPIIVHFTDNPSHTAEEYRATNSSVTSHTATETFRECEKLGARVIGVANGSSITSGAPEDLYNPPGMAFQSGAVVPLCAFDGTIARSSGRCSDTQCCTRQNGAGRAPTAEGMCPLVFEVDSGGGGLPDAIVSGIVTLSHYSTFRMSLMLENDAENPVDALCLIKGVEIEEVEPPGTCSPTPEFLDGNGDGSPDSVGNATTGSRLMYRFDVSNMDTLDYDGDGVEEEACLAPGTYLVNARIVVTGGAVVSRQQLRFVVE